MGIILALDIITASIDPRGWGQLYDESLRLLQAHPAQLVALTEEEVRGQRRLVYTQALELDAAGPGRRWHVVGDRRSGQTAESFVVYRDLGHYRGRGRGPSAGEAGDAAVEHARDRGARRGGSRTTSVFSEKSQGCPYHEPLVAVLALFEDRLGPAAFAHGDLSADEAARACAWASGVLGRRVEPPVCVRPEALYDRLAAALEGDALLDACVALHAGPRHRMLAVLAARADRVALERWFASRLREAARDGSPEQLGVLELLTAWLDAGLELEVLAAMACSRPEGPRFAPAALAGAALVARRAELAGGIEALLHGWLSSMGLPVHEPEERPRRAAWPTPRRLVALLVRLFPDDRTEIAAAVARDRTRGAAPERPDAAAARDVEPSTELRSLVPSVPRALEDDGAPLTAAGLLLRSAALAAYQATIAIQDHREVGPALRKDPEKAWQAVLVATRGRALFAETWAALDEERDIDFLVFVLGLLAHARVEPGATACHALLWDLPLCRRLQRATTDASWREALERVVAEILALGRDEER